MLSNELRFSTLIRLRDKALSFAELMRELGLKADDSGRFSYHLRMLCDSGLVEYDTSSGKYRLSNIGHEVIKLVETLERVSGDRLEKHIIDLDEERIQSIDLRSYVRSLLKSLHIPSREARGLTKELCTLLDKYGDIIDSQEVLDVLRVLFLKNGVRERIELLKTVSFNISRLCEKLEGHKNLFLLSISTGLDLMKKYVMKSVLSEEILKMHIAGDITINDVECFSLTLQTSSVDLARVHEDLGFSLLKRLANFIRLSVYFSPHKLVNSLNTGLLVNNLTINEKVKNYLHLLINIATDELSSIPRSYSVTLMLDALPPKDLDLDYDSFITLTRKLIRWFTNISYKEVPLGIVLTLKFESLKDLSPYMDVIYNAFKAHTSLVLFKCSMTENNPYCGILKIPRGYEAISTVTFNMLTALINSSFDEELLYERAIMLSRQFGKLLKTSFKEVDIEKCAFVISVHGLDQVTRALTGHHMFESDESLSFAMKLAREMKSIFKDELESLTKLVYSSTSLDYRAYRLPSFYKEPLRSDILRLLESVNITSILPYDVDISLDVRVRLEGLFSEIFDGGSFLNIQVSEPFISREELNKLLKMITESDVSSFAITQDFTCCEICSSYINDIHLRCSRCSFHLGPSSHYGRVLGYYDRLARLPKLGRKEYYARKRVSLVI